MTLVASKNSNPLCATFPPGQKLGPLRPQGGGVGNDMENLKAPKTRLVGAAKYRKSLKGKNWRKNHQKANRKRINNYQRLWREKNREKVLAYNVRYKLEHGEKRKRLGRAALWRRLGMPEPTRPEPQHCECCGRDKGSRALANDHCHVTNVFRGWLCYSCNSAIGKLGDDLAGLFRAVEYLKRV